MKNLYIFTLALVTLIGCGGGESSAPDQEMIIGELYIVNHGDKIIKNSDAAIIYISHVDGQNESRVELQSGKATILH